VGRRFSNWHGNLFCHSRRHPWQLRDARSLKAFQPAAHDHSQAFPITSHIRAFFRSIFAQSLFTASLSTPLAQ
jgi:hypothetical protein